MTGSSLLLSSLAAEQTRDTSSIVIAIHPNVEDSTSPSIYKEKRETIKRVKKATNTDRQRKKERELQSQLDHRDGTTQFPGQIATPAKNHHDSPTQLRTLPQAQGQVRQAHPMYQLCCLGHGLCPHLSHTTAPRPTCHSSASSVIASAHISSRGHRPDDPAHGPRQ
ncbi:hypothetical protein ASPFODRAFT_41547 [Aspergillus luchuensis CBS 106.47]|uniref:Uncharacterized protein n=1 Tax=Aspergillus luchuensis (strain CBS 106.47) TaxID=1137211 RepID=A0A1M3TWF0_ASPLC|nr:hypothetical protein ASPFODRAFT_41547 [Aspergillus luchuensis CBS 106.47]